MPVQQDISGEFLLRMEAPAQKIRTFVFETLRRHGADLDTVPRETLLIRDGAYCGHRYQVGSHQAVWFIEEDEVKFYGPEGGVLETVHPTTALPLREAA